MAFVVRVCFRQCTILKMEKYFPVSEVSFIKMTFSSNVFTLVRNGVYFPRRLLGDCFISCIRAVRWVIMQLYDPSIPFLYIYIYTHVHTLYMPCSAEHKALGVLADVSYFAHFNPPSVSPGCRIQPRLCSCNVRLGCGSRGGRFSAPCRAICYL